MNQGKVPCGVTSFALMPFLALISPLVHRHRHSTATVLYDQRSFCQDDVMANLKLHSIPHKNT